MLNRFAKLLLVLTALSPILGAVAINQLANHRHWMSWAPWIIVGVLLVFICWGLLHYAAKNAQKQPVEIKEFERRDSEVLAFLVAYLLPFISAKDMAFTGEWLTGAYILLILALVISHTGAFHFNPVMGLLGYHFYGVKNSHGAPLLVISKKELSRTGVELQTVRLAHNIFLYVEETHA